MVVFPLDAEVTYFYREMSAVLRWVSLPFLLLAGVTIVAIAGELLRVVGIFDYNILFHNPLQRGKFSNRTTKWRCSSSDMSRLGIIDNVLQVVITINSIFLVLFGIPAALVQRDLKRTLNRFRLLTNYGITPNLDSDEPYVVRQDPVGNQHRADRSISKTTGTGWPSGPKHWIEYP
jgi:hypothetical protein